jgi:hypothetical protein
LEKHICREEQRMYIDSSMILTPGAKDELLKRGVEIVYSAKPAKKDTAVLSPENSKSGAATGTQERALAERVVHLLTSEYGLTDREKIMDISMQVIEKMRKL